jgi:hypothetical protein
LYATCLRYREPDRDTHATRAEALITPLSADMEAIEIGTQSTLCRV